MNLRDFEKTFGNAKILSCKQASIDAWERIEESITMLEDGEIDFNTAFGAIHYEVSTILEILDKNLYDYTFWCEVDKILAEIKED